MDKRFSGLHFAAVCLIGTLFAGSGCVQLDSSHSGAATMPPAIPEAIGQAAAMAELEAARGRAGAPVIVQEVVPHFS